MCFRINKLVIIVFILSGVIFTACSPVAVTTESAPAKTYETPIAMPYPTSPVELSLFSDLPGMIRVIGYSGNDFVTGTIQVSNQDWMPKIEESSGKVSITQTSKVVDSQDLTNLWKLRVSDNRPFRLDIRNGQSEGHWNFSGLPITDLYADLGVGKNAFTFDETNPNVMQKWEFVCGTGDVIAEGILNAACRNMVIEAGKGNLTLRFGGKEILQDLNVTIQAGTGTINISISPDIPARITVAGRNQVILGNGMIKLDVAGNSNIYQTPSYHDVQDKAVKINISGGSGTIYLNPPPS